VVAKHPDMGNLRARLARGQRLLGLDPGARRVGVALSDVSLTIATPAATLPRGKLGALADALRPLVAKEGVGGLVVGLPLSMDGSFGPAAQAARDFARALAETLDLPWAMFDERLSSAAVNRALISEADATRARQARLVDSMAAAYMLQAALDASTPPIFTLDASEPSP
jgi:putative holliday junction resolvase